LETSLHDIRSGLESWEKRALISESREERQNKEILILKKQISDFQAVQVENENLVKILREMKKSISINGNSPSTPTDVVEDGNRRLQEVNVIVERTQKELLQKLQDDRMIIIQRDIFRESIPYSCVLHIFFRVHFAAICSS
jgi:hypothetical protein